jgi:hypothetical protein
LPEKIRDQGCIYWLTLGGGKYVYIGAYLKNIYDLEPLVNFVKKEAALPNPVVGIMATAPYPVPLKTAPADLALCSLDYRII